MIWEYMWSDELGGSSESLAFSFQCIEPAQQISDVYNSYYVKYSQVHSDTKGRRSVANFTNEFGILPIYFIVNTIAFLDYIRLNNFFVSAPWNVGIWIIYVLSYVCLTENLKTAEDQTRESLLLKELVSVVNQRDMLVTDLDVQEKA